MDQDLRKADASHARVEAGALDQDAAPLRKADRVMNGTVRLIRRVTIAIIGGTVALIGVVMIVTPGPAIVVLPAGLAILAIEFEFARRWLRAVKERAQSMANHGPSAGRD
jgi:hypothetical protein